MATQQIWKDNYLFRVKGLDHILKEQSENNQQQGQSLQGIRQSDGKVIFRARMEL